jgi:ribonuclease HI
MTTTNTDEKPAVVIYTDGACQGNPGPGGWGAHMNNGTKTRELWGGESPTTNQRMELTAAVKALEFFPTRRRISIHSDSQYLVKGMTEWMPKWAANRWRKHDGHAPDNLDLWKRLRELAALHEVTWHWVKGHAGHPLNERADALAAWGVDHAQRPGVPFPWPQPLPFEHPAQHVGHAH